MKEESISWYKFPEETPTEIKDKLVLLERKDKKIIEAGYIDDKGEVFLDTSGVYGGVIITSEVIFIACRPVRQ